MKPKAGQLGIEGIGSDIPLSGNRPPTKSAVVGEKNAVVRVLFPAYFGLTDDLVGRGEYVDHADTVPWTITDALKGTDATKNTVSIAGGRKSESVVLPPDDMAVILEFPEALHRRVENRYRTTQKGRSLPQDEAAIEAYRSGGHAVEERIPDMENLVNTYTDLSRKLDVLKKAFAVHFGANTDGDQLLVVSTEARGEFHRMLDTIAIAHGWDGLRLTEAHASMDWRLLGGRGEKRLKEKIQYWRQLSGTLGRYTIRRTAAVNNRIGRSRAIVDKMPDKVR